MEDQSATIEFLSQPASYGIAEPVTRCETHAAIVFLAGTLAYKLKRAVLYSYLDYSTVQRRRAMCEAELDINRQTAPDLYIRVQPIVRVNGHLQFGDRADPTDAVDWVVVMRRFAESDLLSRRLAAGGAPSALLLELAAEIARFHAAAEPQHGFGGSDAIARTIAESAQLLTSFARRPFEAETGEKLRQTSQSLLARRAQLLDQRKYQGFVRQCHGDLHLDNVCVLNGRPVLFDAIEFNPDFSNIDVFYDLAFLLMDLDRRNARAAANLVLNRYLEITGDFTGIGGLPLFLSCRAAVRAHVAATTADRVPAQAAGQMRKEAAALAQSALDYLAPAPPCLIAIGGVSGTGKSVLARGLAGSLGAAPGAIVLRSDVIRKRMFGVADDVRLPDSAYTEDVTARVYEDMRQKAALLLGYGHSVIADAVHGNDDEQRAIESVAHEARAKFSGLWLHADMAVLEQRLGNRTGDVSDAVIATARRQAGFVSPPAAWNTLDVTQLAPNECVSAAALLIGTPWFHGI